MKNWSFLGKIGMLIIAFYLVAITMYLVSQSKSHEVITGDSFEGPSRSHLLGTNDLGIDILAQLLFGGAISIGVGFSAAFLAGIGGSVIGVIAGYYGGRIDKWVMSVIDIVTAVPSLIVLIVVGAFLKFTVGLIIVLISLLVWVGPARATRAMMLQIREERYLLAAKSYGANFWYLLKRHLIKALYPLVVLNFIRIFSQAITMESSLAFLGIGDPTLKSWGAIIQQSVNYPGIYYMESWKWWVVPAVVIFVLSIVAVALVGRDMEKIVDRKLVKS